MRLEKTQCKNLEVYLSGRVLYCPVCMYKSVYISVLYIIFLIAISRFSCWLDYHLKKYWVTEARFLSQTMRHTPLYKNCHFSMQSICYLGFFSCIYNHHLSLYILSHSSFCSSWWIYLLYFWWIILSSFN